MWRARYRIDRNNRSTNRETERERESERENWRTANPLVQESCKWLIIRRLYVSPLLGHTYMYIYIDSPCRNACLILPRNDANHYRLRVIMWFSILCLLFSRLHLSLSVGFIDSIERSLVHHLVNRFKLTLTCLNKK